MINKNNRIIFYCVYSALAAGITLLFMCLFALIIYFFDVNRKIIPLISTVSAAAGCLISCFFAGKKTKEKGYLTGLITGGTAFVIITVVSLFVSKNGLTLNTLFHFIIMMLSSVIGGIAGVNSAQNKKII